MHTGGRKTFVYTGEENYKDTEHTKKFKEKYRKWINRPRFSSFSYKHHRPTKKRYFEDYEYAVVRGPNLKQYIIPIILAIIIIFLFSKWANDGTFDRFVAKLSETKRDFTSDMKDAGSEIKESITTKIEEVEKELEQSREEKCKGAFEYLNKLREENGRNKIKWDERAYQLAVARSKDMYERDYFDHITPEGTCAKDMKFEYGFEPYEILAENAGGMTHYEGGIPIPGTSPNEAVDIWMGSRGHRYNLLYNHISGAIGCYRAICVFFGVHSDPYGLGAGPCTSGEEGLAFWESMVKQEGEI